MTFCPHCDGPLFKGKRIAVVGGGNSGVEAAIDLAGVAGQVTVVEFLGDGAMVTGLTYEDRTTGEPHHLDLGGIFVQIGLLANLEWLDGTIELSPRKEIVIDARGATSSPGVFAAGDCTTVPYQQIVIAMGAGATAALSAFDYLIRSSAPQEDAPSRETHDSASGRSLVTVGAPA